MFDEERAAFQRLHDEIARDEIVRTDIETALADVLSRYSTSIFENRFIVGGAAEVIIAAALRASGIAAVDAAAEGKRGDLRLPGGAAMSVKCSFQKARSTIRLINVLGESTDARWNEGTIFVVSGIGIGYADPDLLPDATQRRKDVVELDFRLLRTLWEKSPELLARLSVPVSLQESERSLLASRVIAREVLLRTTRLRDHIPA